MTPTWGGKMQHEHPACVPQPVGKSAWCEYALRYRLEPYATLKSARRLTRHGVAKCLTSNSPRLSPANISRDVGSESRHTSARGSVNGYVALITDEASRSRVKDHHTKQLQVAVGVILNSVRKETGRRLRVYQFWPKVLNLTRENLRSLDSQKPRFCSKTRRVFCPVCPRSSLS